MLLGHQRRERKACSGDCGASKRYARFHSPDKGFASLYLPSETKTSLSFCESLRIMPDCVRRGFRICVKTTLLLPDICARQDDTAYDVIRAEINFNNEGVCSNTASVAQAS